MNRRRTTTRVGLCGLSLALVLTGCSADDRSAAEDDGGLEAPLPGQPDRPGEATIDADHEAAADGDVAHPADPETVPVVPRNPDVLSEPLPEPVPEVRVEPREPVEQPWVSPWQDAAVDPQSTFGLDVDTVSYGRIREALTTGHRIDPREVRVEEVVNALDYGYTTSPDEVFAVKADGAAWPWGREPGTHLLRVGLATPPAEVRDPVDLVLVIDASGSMSAAMHDVKDALAVLVDSLQPGADRIAVVAYDSTARTVLAPTDVTDRDTVMEAIGSLTAGGTTNLAEGLALGYAEAARMTEEATEGVNTRVVLLSDGIANTGVTDLEGILELVGEGVDTGIEMLTVGFGMSGFNDPLMEQLADRGDGRAVYVDTPEEARRLFSEQLATTLQTVARDARSQVEFNPELVAAYRLLGYDNRAIADDDFRDDTVDAGEIGAGHTVTALYEIDLHDVEVRPTGDRTVARVSLRWLDPDGGSAREVATSVTLDDIASGWESAPGGLRLAGTAAAWAEVLRQSPHATVAGLDDLASEARRIADAVGTGQLREWADLVARSAEA